MKSSLGRTVGAWLGFVLAITGCGGDDPEGEGGSTDGATDVVDACDALCEAQGQGMGCTEATVTSCEQLCALQSAKTGACADATVASFQCRKQMTWKCSSGSDLAVSLDATCDEEMGVVEAACGQ